MSEYRESKTNPQATKPITAPLEEIWTYTTSKPIEYVPYVGILTHIDGATYPRKGNPTPLAVHLINIIKTLLLQSLKHPKTLLLTNKQEILLSFNIVFEKTFSPLVTGQEFRIKEEYLCPTAYSLMKFIDSFLTAIGYDKNISHQFAYNIAHIFEYDDAYRYRFQDIITECNIQILKHYPVKEIRRLLTILNEREAPNNQTAPKITHHILQILPLLLIFRVKKAFKQSVHHLSNCKYDPSDYYWASLKGDDYKFTGKSPQDRMRDLQIPKMVKITQ